MSDREHLGTKIWRLKSENSIRREFGQMLNEKWIIPYWNNPRTRPTSDINLYSSFSEIFGNRNIFLSFFFFITRATKPKFIIILRRNFNRRFISQNVRVRTRISFYVRDSSFEHRQIEDSVFLATRRLCVLEIKKRERERRENEGSTAYSRFE